jgi:hypothetical protein
MVYLPGLASPVDDSHFALQGLFSGYNCPGYTIFPPHWVHFDDEAPLQQSRFGAGPHQIEVLQRNTLDPGLCQPDGGLGPWVFRFDQEAPAYSDGPHQIGISHDPSGIVACVADLQDGGPQSHGLLYRFPDGSAWYAPDAGPNCFELSGRLAVAGSAHFRSGGGYLIESDMIQFEASGAKRLATFPPGARCSLSAVGSALCVSGVNLSLVSASSSTIREWRVDVGDAITVYRPTLRGRQYVQRVRRDGGYSYYWFRGQELDLLVEGLPVSTIGDWDDGGAVLVSYADQDGGTRVHFERLCLP